MHHQARTRANLEAIVRKVLHAAYPQDAGRYNGPLDAIRRKHLIQQARLRAARYNLQAELDAFIYQAGCEAITGLDHQQLIILDDWIGKLITTAEAACDPDGPPAR